MTIYGRRNSLLLIREQNGHRETIRIDMRDKNLVNSPYFYLQQNDVIYVEPNDPRARASESVRRSPSQFRLLEPDIFNDLDNKCFECKNRSSLRMEYYKNS